jgi:hypothetical protein
MQGGCEGEEKERVGRKDTTYLTHGLMWIARPLIDLSTDVEEVIPIPTCSFNLICSPTKKKEEKRNKMRSKRRKRKAWCTLIW